MIAGDVFDGEWRDNSIAFFLNRQLARLSNHGVPTFFLRGNHDAESVVAKSLTWSDKVFEFSTRRPETHRIEDLRVALHGRGFPHREVVENYAVDYPGPLAGWFNIGVLHTACGRAGHENYAPCTAADLAARGDDIGRSATSTRSKSSRAIHGSSIPAICRAAASENRGERGRSL